MISEAAAEDAGNMKQLVNQGFGLFGFGKTVVIFGDELDDVMGRKGEAGLYGLRQAVAAGQDPAAFGPSASDRTDAPGLDVIHLKRSDDPREYLVNFRCRKIFQKSSPNFMGRRAKTESAPGRDSR